jgi:hypothetical protein
VDSLIDPVNTLPFCSIDSGTKRSKYFGAAPGRVEISLTSGRRGRVVESSVCCVTCLSSLAAPRNVALVEKGRTLMYGNWKKQNNGTEEGEQGIISNIHKTCD